MSPVAAAPPVDADATMEDAAAMAPGGEANTGSAVSPSPESPGVPVDNATGNEPEAGTDRTVALVLSEPVAKEEPTPAAEAAPVDAAPTPENVRVTVPNGDTGMDIAIALLLPTPDPPVEDALVEKPLSGASNVEGAAAPCDSDPVVMQSEGKESDGDTDTRSGRGEPCPTDSAADEAPTSKPPVQAEAANAEGEPNGTKSSGGIFDFIVDLFSSKPDN